MNNDLSGKLETILSNPEMMAQIKILADSMSKDSSPTTPKQDTKADADMNSAVQTSQPAGAAPAGTSPLLPGTSAPVSTIAKNLSNSRTLLLALKPYLDEKRSGKVDRMLNMMKMSEVAGYLRNFL